MASADIKVSVEAAAHKAMRELAQQVLDNYGIRIESAAIRWHDQCGGYGNVGEVELVTRYVGEVGGIDAKSRP